MHGGVACGHAGLAQHVNDEARAIAITWGVAVALRAAVTDPILAERFQGPAAVVALLGNPLADAVEAKRLEPFCLACHDTNGASGAAPFIRA